MTTLRLSAVAILLGVAIPSLTSAQDEITTRRRVGVTTLDVSQFQSNWRPLPEYAAIRTWFDGTGYQVAMSADAPWSSVGWLESPAFTVPRMANDAPGNVSVMTVRYTFTPIYTGMAPEMRVRFHTADFVSYATSSVTSARFNELRSLGRGEVRVTFDRTGFTNDRSMRAFIDLISVTAPGNADPGFHFRINEVFIEHFEPTVRSLTDSRVTGSFIESDGDVAVYVGDSTTRRQLMSDADSYAADGSYVIALRSGNLIAFDGPNDFARVDVQMNGRVISGAVSGEHIMWVQNNDELHYFNIRNGNKFRVDRDRAFLGVVPQGSGSFVAISRELSHTTGRRFFAYDALRPSPTLRRLSNDSTGLYVNVGSTGVVPRKSLDLLGPEPELELLSGSWFMAE